MDPSDPAPECAASGPPFPLSEPALLRVLTSAGVPAGRARQFAGPLRDALAAHGLTSRAQLSHLLAQVLHESARLRYVREVASGRAYEGRRDLGNDRPGDGPRFRGRGLIQLTGRANYTAFRDAMRQRYGAAEDRGDAPDFVASPKLVEGERWAIESALWYWDRRVRPYADREDRADVVRVTKAVNGGLNGFEDRLLLFMRVGAALRAEGL